MTAETHAIADLTEIHDALAVDNANDAWLSRARSATRRYFGEGSEEHRFISDFTFRFTGTQFSGMQDIIARHKARKVEEAKQFIKDCISTIRRHGVYQQPTQPTPQPAVSVMNIQQQGDGSAFAAQSSSVKYQNNKKKTTPAKIGNDIWKWFGGVLGALLVAYLAWRFGWV